jgi:hypothetical protein
MESTESAWFLIYLRSSIPNLVDKYIKEARKPISIEYLSLNERYEAWVDTYDRKNIDYWCRQY